MPNKLIRALQLKQKEEFQNILFDIDKQNILSNTEYLKHLRILLEKCIITPSSLAGLIKQEISSSKRFVSEPITHQKMTFSLYKETEKQLLLKIHNSLLAIYDIFNENNKKWHNKWNILPLNKSNIEYEHHQTGIIIHLKLTEKSKKILENNKNNYKKCCKWRYLQLKWLKNKIKFL